MERDCAIAKHILSKNNIDIEENQLLVNVYLHSMNPLTARCYYIYIKTKSFIKWINYYVRVTTMATQK
jgi:hypothetical protein